MLRAPFDELLSYESSRDMIHDPGPYQSPKEKHSCLTLQGDVSTDLTGNAASRIKIQAGTEIYHKNQRFYSN